jgi:hypothetical protein
VVTATGAFATGRERDTFALSTSSPLKKRRGTRHAQLMNGRTNGEITTKSEDEKMEQKDTDKAFEDWVKSFPDFMEPSDGKLYVIRKPDDLQKVHEDLFNILGE